MCLLSVVIITVATFGSRKPASDRVEEEERTAPGCARDQDYQHPGQDTFGSSSSINSGHARFGLPYEQDERQEKTVFIQLFRPLIYTAITCPSWSSRYMRRYIKLPLEAPLCFIHLRSWNGGERQRGSGGVTLHKRLTSCRNLLGSAAASRSLRKPGEATSLVCGPLRELDV